jgi:HEAT repeat protein
MEAVWGTTEDMAQELRSICVLALASCTDLRREDIMRRLVEALVDDSHRVRQEAVRALEQMDGDESPLLLRLKAHVGDQEAAVAGQVFDSLLNLERGRGVAFVAGFLRSGADEVREEAALALGLSRLEGTVEILCEAFDTAGPTLRAAILRGLGASRQPAAIEFLRKLSREGSRAIAAAAREALELIGAPVTPP